MSIEHEPKEDDEFELLRLAVDDIFGDAYPGQADAFARDEALVIDIYSSAQKVEIAAANIARIAVNVFGGYYPKEVGVVESNADSDTIILRPIGCTEIGVLCALDGIKNAHNEQEYLMIEGSVVVAKHDDLFLDGSTAFLLDQWPEAGSNEFYRARIANCASILTRKLLTSSHMSFRPIYTTKEYEELSETEEAPVDPDDFRKIKGKIKGTAYDLRATTYSLITPGIISGIAVETGEGNVYRFDI